MIELYNRVTINRIRQIFFKPFHPKFGLPFFIHMHCMSQVINSYNLEHITLETVPANIAKLMHIDKTKGFSFRVTPFLIVSFQAKMTKYESIENCRLKSHLLKSHLYVHY
jgi:hypothetical protein